MSSSPGARLVLPVGARDHRQGPANAPITLVEYGDYECPFCALAYPIVKRAQSEFGEQLQFVFRNFPLTASHPHAELAAEAAESAGAQGRFWEMHDQLYEHPQDLTISGLTRIARSAGADPDQVERDLRASTFEDRVYQDFMSGVRSGVSGTPAFFVNGARYDGSWEEDALVAMLRSVNTGVKPRER